MACVSWPLPPKPGQLRVDVGSTVPHPTVRHKQMPHCAYHNGGSLCYQQRCKVDTSTAWVTSTTWWTAWTSVHICAISGPSRQIRQIIDKYNTNVYG